MDKEAILRYLEYRKKDAIRAASRHRFDDYVIEFLRVLFSEMKHDIEEL